MRLGIISDTHDQLERTRQAVALLVEAGAEALIHCGDLLGPPIVEACSVLPAYFVFGNNEDDLPGLRRAMRAANAVCLEYAGQIELAGKRIAVTHGHLDKELRRLAETKPDYLLTGHSHVRHDYREGAARHINPGALHRAAEFSVAVLDLHTDELRFLPIER